MDAKFDGLTDREILILLSEDFLEFKEDALSLRKTIYGNGGIGLNEKHNTLSVKVDGLIRAITFIGGAVVILVIGFLFGIFTGQIKVVF